MPPALQKVVENYAHRNKVNKIYWTRVTKGVRHLSSFVLQWLVAITKRSLPTNNLGFYLIMILNCLSWKISRNKCICANKLHIIKKINFISAKKEAYQSIEPYLLNEIKYFFDVSIFYGLEILNNSLTMSVCLLVCRILAGRFCFKDTRVE